MITDLRHAVRAYLRNPGLTTAALVSLAIGIGATTSIFSVTNALLLRPLPYASPDRLVILWNRSPGLHITEDWFSTAQYFDIKTSHRGFEQVAIAIGGNTNLTGIGEPERVGTIRISSSLLTMLGVRPAAGRGFVSEEDRPGRPATALLSHGMWARRFGRDPRVVGRLITLNGQSYQVIGVMPQTFSLPREVLPTLGGAEQAEVLLPLPLAPAAAQDRDHEDYNVVAKLKPGVSVQQAQAELDAITARLRRDFPEIYPPNGGLTFSIVPLQEQVVGGIRRALFLLLASVTLLLLIACANVANLLLSRAVARRKEFAVRAALGADRVRIVRQLLTESVLLAAGGGLLGTVLCFWSLDWIRVLGEKSLPRLESIAIDGRVLAFALAVSLVSAILFALAPCLRAARIDLRETLHDASRGSSGMNAMWGRGQNIRRLLAMAEVALSVVLLIGAALLVRSFQSLQSVAPGFNPYNLLTLELTMSGRRYNDRPAVLNTYRQLWAKLAEVPGVTACGGISSLPLSQSFAWGPINIEGRVPAAGEKFLNADMRFVGGRYFQAMQIPLRRGRLFDERDNATGQRVVIVDEHMAAELWPNDDAVGKRIRPGGLNANGPWQTVVGVVGTVKHESLDSDPRIAIYLPHEQYPARAMTLVIRSAADAAALTASVKSLIQGIDPDLPLYSVRTMQHRVWDSLARRRFSMLLLAVFSAFALALATIGVYGVMAYLVSQSTRDIGIRIALGATETGILRLVVGQGMMLALMGTGIGVGAGLVLARLMSSLLFGIGSGDIVTFTAIPLLPLTIALVATYIPARRATRVDPMTSLRCE
jgi:predicted permease